MDTRIMGTSTAVCTTQRKKRKLREARVSCECRRLARGSCHCSPPTSPCRVLSTASYPRPAPGLDKHDIMYHLGVVCLHSSCTFSYWINYIFCIYYTLKIQSLFLYLCELFRFYTCLTCYILYIRNWVTAYFINYNFICICLLFYEVTYYVTYFYLFYINKINKFGSIMYFHWFNDYIFII